MNCAGWVHDGAILDCEDGHWDRAFNLNAKSLFQVTKAVLPGMLDHGSGSIVNIASIVSSEKGAPRRFAYGAPKAAVIGMTKSIAADYVQHGICRNAICPGAVESPSLQDRLKATGDFDKAHAAFTPRQPIGRFGTPDKIAEMVCYLAEDMSAFPTGQAFAIRRRLVNLMRLDRAASIDDLRIRPKARITRFAFDLVDGGARSERNVQRNSAAFPSSPARLPPQCLRVWRQLLQGKAGLAYVPSDASISRAEMAEHDLLMVTADVPAAGKRDRSIRNQLAVPFKSIPEVIAGLIAKPRWSLATLRHGKPNIANCATCFRPRHHMPTYRKP